MCLPGPSLPGIRRGALYGIPVSSCNSPVHLEMPTQLLSSSRYLWLYKTPRTLAEHKPPADATVARGLQNISREDKRKVDFENRAGETQGSAIGDSPASQTCRCPRFCIPGARPSYRIQTVGKIWTSPARLRSDARLQNYAILANVKAMMA